MIKASLSRKLTKHCIVIYGRNDYLIEAEKQLYDKKVDEKVSNSESKLCKLAEMSNKMLSSLEKRGYITEKQLKFFPTNIEKSQTLVNFISFSKFIKVCMYPRMVKYFQLRYTCRKIARNF